MCNFEFKISIARDFLRQKRPVVRIHVFNASALKVKISVQTTLTQFYDYIKLDCEI